MGKGNKAFIEALLWKLGKEHYATVFRIYYSGFVSKAATCVLHSKTNTVLLVFSAKLFSSVELMTNNMLEEISGQSKLIYYSTITTKTEKLHFVQWNNMRLQFVQFLPLSMQLAALIGMLGK